MAKKKTEFLYSSLYNLKKIKKKRDQLAPASQALYDQLLELHSGDIRAVVDGTAGLSTADRKAYVTPYVELGRALKKAHNPKSRGYQAPPWGTMKGLARLYAGFLAWLKNGHRYREGELNAPASEEALLELQTYLRGAMDKADYFLPSAFVDAYRVCDGVSASLRMHPETGLRMMSVAEIQVQHAALSEQYGKPYLVPFSDDGAGNFFTLWGSEVYDLNHEDGGAVAMAPGLQKVLSKAHKPTRW